VSELEILRLAAVRRVATRAGALRFNAAIGSIIGSDVANTTTAQRSATLQRLLSLYNQMRAAKLYGQEDQFKAASAAMADAITKYAQQSPGGADKIRDVVKKLSFADEEAQRKKALQKRDASKKS
jgi:hypothetical protein